MPRKLLTAEQKRERRNAYMRKYMRERYRRLKREASRRFWLPAEISQLQTQYPHMPTKLVARLLDRPLETVYAKANALGLSKTAEYLASPAACRLRRGDEVGKAYRFRKGQVPANKGLRRPGWAAGRMRETQFKKGQMPWNTRYPLQSERVNADGYLDRKISMTCKGATAWISVHKLVWMQAHGDVPPGHIIVFRDGNKMNVALDNLECISLAENMKRNTVHNLPKPLAQVVQLRGALVRQIRKRERKEA